MRNAMESMEKITISDVSLHMKIYVDIVGVTGSIPVPPTTRPLSYQ